MNKKDTLAFIKNAHMGQKYGSEPYWTHPKAVADLGKKVFGSKFTEIAYIAALLHDVVEDTNHGINELKNLGYSDEILSAVELLTKDNSLSYEANIKRIISSGNRIAMMVKYCDNNMNYHGDKSTWDEKRRIKSQTKYAKSLNTLGKKLGVKADYPEE